MLIDASVAAGAYDKARFFIEMRDPEWFDDEADIPDGPFMHFAAVNAASVLQAEERHERAGEILEAALAAMQGIERNRGGRAYGMLDAKVHALLGNREEALAALEECAEAGFLPGWRELRFASYYDSIRQDPRFASVLERFDRMADAAREQAIAQGLL